MSPNAIQVYSSIVYPLCQTHMNQTIIASLQLGSVVHVTEQASESSSSQMSTSKKLNLRALHTVGSPIRRLACT